MYGYNYIRDTDAFCGYKLTPSGGAFEAVR